MNKLDKQFEEMMKGMNLASPSSDFALKVMSRVRAEAAVRPKPVLQDYQPVISKKAWIIIIAAFMLLMIYVATSGQGATPAEGTGIWSMLFGKLAAFDGKNASSALKTGAEWFTSIPTIAYLILIAGLALWTLDGLLGKFKQQHSEIHV